MCFFNTNYLTEMCFKEFDFSLKEIKSNQIFTLFKLLCFSKKEKFQKTCNQEISHLL